jgi:hypothetical protein
LDCLFVSYYKILCGTDLAVGGLLFVSLLGVRACVSLQRCAVPLPCRSYRYTRPPSYNGETCEVQSTAEKVLRP